MQSMETMTVGSECYYYYYHYYMKKKAPTFMKLVEVGSVLFKQVRGYFIYQKRMHFMFMTV